MASTCVAPSKARQASSPPAIPMITTSTLKMPSAPNFTTRWAHFTCTQSQLLPHRRLSATGGSGSPELDPGSRRLPTAQIGPNPGLGLPRVILGLRSQILVHARWSFWEKYCECCVQFPMDPPETYLNCNCFNASMLSSHFNRDFYTIREGARKKKSGKIVPFWQNQGGGSKKEKKANLYFGKVFFSVSMYNHSRTTKTCFTLGPIPQCHCKSF